MDIHYQAYDATGKRVTGVMAAATENEAVEKLRALGLIPFNTSRTGASAASFDWLTRDISFGGPKLEDRASYCKMLAAMIEAGLAVDKANLLMAGGEGSRRITSIASAAAESLAAGEPLSRALSRSGLGFPSDETGLIQAGEQSGSLVPALNELSDALERRASLRGRLLSAALYPIVLACMALASLTVIVLVLAPNVAPLFQQLGKEPPVMIRLALALHDIVTGNGLTVLASLAAVVGLLYLLWRAPPVASAIESLKYRFRIPRLIESARLCRTLGTLLHHGVPLQQALPLAAAALRGAGHRTQLLEARDRVTAGTRLATALEGVSALPAAARDLIRAGEDTNRLDTFLLHAATQAEQDAARRMERLMTLLTPVLTIALGVIVGGLIMSVMRAILSINDAVLQ